MTDSGRQAWEERAEASGSDPSGVLMRGLPSDLNQYFHDRNLVILCQEVLPRIPVGGTLLDLGCGYGRVSELVRSYRPDIQLIGVDFSLNFCRSYRKQLGESAICADVMQLPLKPQSFDAVIAVVVLMYVPPERRVEIIKSVLGLLGPGGFGLFVDPGREYLEFAAHITGRRSPTGGWGFGLTEYKALLTQYGGRVLVKGGMPIFSLMLPVLMFVKSEKIRGYLLRMVGAIERHMSGWTRFSLYRWIVVDCPVRSVSNYEQL